MFSMILDYDEFDFDYKSDIEIYIKHVCITIREN